MKRRAVFIDRDGTINYDPGYLGDPARFRFLAGVVDALRRLRSAGFLLFIISNQSGIARGYFRREDLDRIHEMMLEALRREGVVMDGIYYCPHHPEDGCTCRKPSPEMVIRAARSNDIDLGSSYFIGDRETDIETGKNAGCRTILVLTGEGENTRRRLTSSFEPDFIATDLGAAADWILRGDGGSKAQHRHH